MLGDVKMRECPDKLDASQSSVLADADRKMLDKLALPEERPRFRARFMSTSKAHRHRKSRSRMSTETRLLLDEFYHSPAKLLLSHLGDWNFNIFSLEALSAGRSLFHVAYHLFQTYDLIKGFHLDSVRLMQFFSLVEENYHETNPYHNAVHAADVTQSMHCYLQESEIYQATTELEKMAALIAALTHDLDHPGVNNSFLIVTSNHLATLYQNISVLENHHWRSAVGLLQETGLLSHWGSSQRDSFYQQLKTLILATDITRRQEFLLKFTRYIESGEFQYRSNQEQRHFLLQIALKCADISNPCRPWRVSQRWSRRICKEFFLQGDTERALSVAVTPLCDRLGNTIANIQHGFIQFVVSPLFKAWDAFLGTELSGQMMNHMTRNQARWKSIMDQGREVREEDSDSDDGQLDDIEPVGAVVAVAREPAEEAMDVSNSNADNEASPLPSPRPLDQLEHSEHEEEEEGKSEEDDVVENDVNLVYHYPTETIDERGLSPVSEDSEQGFPSASTIRRYSVPYVVRKDLNFYLGLRKDSTFSTSQCHRRQSLPTSAMYFHGSSSSNPGSACPSPRSLSMDTLLSRPKIINLSPSMETSLFSSVLEPLNFIPLKNQTLMLQGGTLTRFTTNPTGRRGSYEPMLSEHSRLSSNPNSDYEGLSQGKSPSDQQTSTVGLASSWPSVAQRRTTNGSVQHHTPSTNSSIQSINAKSSPGFPQEEDAHTYQQPSMSSSLGMGEEEEEGGHNPSSSSQHERSLIHHSQCLSLSANSPSHDSQNLPRPQ